MFRRQVKADRAAQFRAALARNHERANPTTDAEHELELATKVKDIFHFARNDVIPVSAVISFNSRVFGAYRDQNSLADLGAIVRLCASGYDEELTQQLMLSNDPDVRRIAQNIN